MGVPYLGQGWRQDGLSVRFVVEYLVRWFHFDILGFLLGYLNGPILAESQEERKARHSHAVELPEKSAEEE